MNYPIQIAPNLNQATGGEVTPSTNRTEISNSDLSVSLIIPVYNGGEKFRRCLTSIAQASPPPDEVIVVADGDTDESWLLAKKFGFKVRRLSQCKGPATARNEGVKEATGDILFFVDADVEIPPDAIGKVVETFQQEPDLTALIGSYDDQPDANNFLSQYKNLFHHYTHQNGCEEASTFWGACGAIRRHVFLKMTGFNQSYCAPSIEDIELGYRLKTAGYRIKLCKNIQVKHLKRWGIISLLRADFFFRALPWTALILNQQQIINDLNLNWTNRVSIIFLYGFLTSLVAPYWYPSLFLPGVILGLALLTINRRVYLFFARKRGWLFALQVIPWHWLYYFYGGLAFVIGSIRHYLSMLFVQGSDNQYIYFNYLQLSLFLAFSFFLVFL